MKLGFSTLSFDSWDIGETIRQCRLWGYTGIELREGSVSFAERDQPSEARREIRSMLDHAGIAVTNIGASIFLLGDSEEEYGRMLLELQAMHTMAKDYGAKGIRVFLGNMESRIDKPRGPIGYERLVQWLQEACGRLAPDGIEIWIETHNEFSTGRRLGMLLRDVDRSNCKVIWDVLHPLEQGESPETTLGFLGAHCAHVHIKDAVPHDHILENNWRYTGIGCGCLPLREMMELLIRQGYDGYYSLEWESRWRPELQGPGMEPETAFREFARFAAGLKQ
ncbi:MAG: hypothetical protein K0R57_1345 [Paenibacillaceae bacterium]|jgi:sugar phosphate isomerase/epimerase|nr:hypothetical protein [Paenibacillaceae bacterium]